MNYTNPSSIDNKYKDLYNNNMNVDLAIWQMSHGDNVSRVKMAALIGNAQAETDFYGKTKIKNWPEHRHYMLPVTTLLNELLNSVAFAAFDETIGRLIGCESEYSSSSATDDQYPKINFFVDTKKWF